LVVVSGIVIFLMQAQGARTMSRNASQPVWRALIVRSRHEKVAADALRSRGLEEFLPLYQSKRAWSDRTKVIDMPLFPGYVFCRFADTQRLLTISSPGVTSVVGFGGKDAVVEDHELESVRRMLAAGLTVEPWSYVRAGHEVEIHSGPLSGLRGQVVREKGLWRLIVNVEMLQRSVSAELERDMVQAIEPCREYTEAVA
jgi:transcription antitermination factor NusG